ncbi:MAG: endonuclease domain-containing protein [Prevotellaceae bacterium]|jgi:very-short-patch-repair endonuclease|nr:endonuclease domain-containing protein [Prevotellaceae bacterium]
MHSKQLFNIPAMKPLRRELRSRLTPAEAALWRMIKNRQLCGERFLRQYSVGCYILDFYCPKHRLAIELDGEIHFNSTAQEYDANRTDYLNSVGIRVLRFENCEVFEHTQQVLVMIENYLRDDSLNSFF